jgi:hypothetical protein
MGYSKFKKLAKVVEKFALHTQTVNLFDDALIQIVTPSSWLEQSLKMAYATPPTNEKAKSERLVSPILLEVYSSYEQTLSFFSGEEIYINAKDNLSGACDFLFSLHPPSVVLAAPIISLVEAKDEDMEWGLAQCAAQLYAAHLFNLQHKKNIPVLYGCATTGIEWQFLKFENSTFYIDRRPITHLPQILGTWHWILQWYVGKPQLKTN